MELPIFSFPDDGSISTQKFHTRHEDMSPEGYLQIIVEDDGDVIVVVNGTGFNPEEYHRVSVQFCTGMGGGQSKRTRNALLYLIEAIQQDDVERPQHKDY